MSKSKSTPAIRFAGFTDAWEQRKLGEMVQFSKGSGYSKGDLKESGTPIILYGRLYTKYETVISDVDTFADAKIGSVYSRGGEVIVPASGETAEDISIASVVENSGVLLGGDLNIITPPANLDSAFLAISISNGKPHNDMAKMAQGKSVVHLHNTDLEKIDLPFPSHAEQEKISAYFKRIDTLITLHQRKYDKLVKVKKAMLEKMFPKGGAKVPEIRFAGFTDAWEQRKLKDAFNFLQNNTLSRADLSLDSGVAKNIHYGDVLIKFGEYLDATKTALPFITSQQIAEKYKSSILQDGDIIMADTAEDETVGKCTEIVNLQGFPAISGLHTIPLRPKDNFATGFLGYYMNLEAYHNQLLPLMQGIKVTSISKCALQDTVISFPSDVAEQAAIGQYFIYLDSLITLHQRKLEKLKTIKKSMLESMFV